jgi:hypothetical protein
MACCAGFRYRPASDQDRDGIKTDAAGKAGLHSPHDVPVSARTVHND